MHIRRYAYGQRYAVHQIVVNRWKELPEDYDVELMELSNGQKGIYPIVREGYRTAEEQQEILDDKIQAYINEGYSQSRTEKTAKEWVALPGTSYEPWHYRYVGVTVAQEIYERGICLEEY